MVENREAQWSGTPAPKADHKYYASPDDWREELIYFLLPDRFNDDSCKDQKTGLLDRKNIEHKAPDHKPFVQWYWNLWAHSGRSRFQGGTINGIRHQLPYLKELGVTTLWLGPVWKQRLVGLDLNYNQPPRDDPLEPPTETAFIQGREVDYLDIFRERDDYHGYSVQDFVSVDPRFGNTQDLCDLVQAAHKEDIRVILDILINHSGENWLYNVPPILSPLRPPFVAGSGTYDFGCWLNAENKPMTNPELAQQDDAVWPEELRKPNLYNRRGIGDYGRGSFSAPYNAEFQVSDYINRDFLYDDKLAHLRIDTHAVGQPGRLADPVLDIMVRIWQHWMAQTDCDGFRVDTFKHIPKSAASTFCEEIWSFAATKLSKTKFLVAGEIGGSDRDAATYLNIPHLRILELGQRRQNLRSLAGGNLNISAQTILTPTAEDLNGSDSDLSGEQKKILAGLSDKDVRNRVLTSIDDHDGLGIGDKLGRLAAIEGEESVIPAAALLLFGPGIPMLYYGTEQALRGPDIPVEQEYLLTGMGLYNREQGGDRYLREAMFGPLHPRPAGKPDLRTTLKVRDVALPGFGPFGTCGLHVFDWESPWFIAIRRMAKLRRERKVLALGEITLLETCRLDGGRFDSALPRGLVAWTRQLDNHAAVIVMNVSKQNDQPTHDVDLTLPEWAVNIPTLMRTTTEISDQRTLDPSATSTGVDRALQTKLPYLPLGVVPRGEVHVFVTPVEPVGAVS